MDTVDKLYFAFNAYDFNSTKSLCYDELSLLLRSAVKGLKKACPEYEVFGLTTSIEVESYTDLIFASANLPLPRGKGSGADRVSCEAFSQYCCSHLVLGSWLKSLASFPPTHLPPPPELGPLDFSLRPGPPPVPQEVPVAVQPLEAAMALPDIKEGGPEGTSEGREEAGPSEESKTSSPAQGLLPRWMKKAALLRPEEVPGTRRDDPDDRFDPQWVLGLNVSGVRQRCVHYLAEGDHSCPFHYPRDTLTLPVCLRGSPGPGLRGGPL